MIFDDLSQASLYRNSAPGLDLAFDYLASFDPSTPDGRYDIDGDRVFALVQSMNTYAAAERQYEAHLKYTDVQYLVSGEEFIFHSPLSRLQPATDYNEAKDCRMYTGPDEQPLCLTPGYFTVLFPHDAHKPGIAPAQSAPIRKVVIKVRVS